MNIPTSSGLFQATFKGCMFLYRRKDVKNLLVDIQENFDESEWSFKFNLFSWFLNINPIFSFRDIVASPGETLQGSEYSQQSILQGFWICSYIIRFGLHFWTAFFYSDQLRARHRFGWHVSLSNGSFVSSLNHSNAFVAISIKARKSGRSSSRALRSPLVDTPSQHASRG